MDGEYRRLIKVSNGAAEFADRCLLVKVCVKKRCCLLYTSDAADE